jgi:hypothetical protein
MRRKGAQFSRNAIEITPHLYCFKRNHRQQACNYQKLPVCQKKIMQLFHLYSPELDKYYHGKSVTKGGKGSIKTREGTRRSFQTNQ